MKLLRPLHRQRTRRRNRFTVLGNEDLAAHFCLRLSELETYLRRHDIPFHKDSCGNLWASLPQVKEVERELSYRPKDADTG